MASSFDGRFTLVDIGAAGGAHPRWETFDNIEIVGFEPFEEEFRKLENSKNRRWLNTGLHQGPGTYPLHITRYPTNVSLLEPNRDVLSNLQFPLEDFDIVRSVPIRCDSLDNVCREHDLRPHALKIDTQGSELFILRGARRALETSVFSVEVEVEFIPAYKNQPLFHEVHDFLTSMGFLLMDLGNRLHVKGRHAEGLGGPKSHWVTADALYFKALGPLERSLSSKDASLGTTLPICVAYGYDDYAAEICRWVMERHPQSAAEAQAALIELKSCRKTWRRLLSETLGRSGILRALQRRACRHLGRIFTPWQPAVWIEGLGNDL